ncbi:hypothetical protein SAMN05444671_1776 [Flavobacterium sp. CF108]|uniref:hypothetical protein n=1 Tax=unclassified Flavobacterium TaxID=196869 RepID=UPI0008D45BEF|nr:MULTISPECIES: hypothetical protein [unclassified Flavobacterium]SEN53592.1 hypothetical protein SAMN04487978_1092 [Flavobacterium sp. fv08]SHG98862.1 hypothetical protein SAMN05444671_1776 [Flavobacterium sp. CF108]
MKKFNPEEKLKKAKLTESEIENFHSEYLENKSIVGIDIYKYSEYKESIQVYVPVLFNSIYDLTIKMCLKNEPFFFSNYGNKLSDFKENFISTGDGGFQIFDNPFQSLLFCGYFELNVRRFNSGSYISTLNKNLFSIIDRIELRYCLTYDKIICYDNNFYGAGIINNARILAKDSLNRLLIDQNSLRWFEHHINTIENLTVITLNDLLEISLFKDLDKKLTSLLFKKSYNYIKSLDILKIGNIISKNTNLNIYNLKIQFEIGFDKERGMFKKEYANFVFTVGNLNTQGIN